MAAPDLDFRNTNTLWGGVIAETLVRCGVREAVLSPGSRSAPLTFALARHPGIETVPVLDERSAAFFALGLARQHRRTVALVCTSGTAAANFLPAVIEAHESGVPLLVLTADRPPELRECRAGQAIDQQKLYGTFVRHYHELAVPAADLGLLRYVRQTVAHAVARTRAPAPGPVHLNAPFRDPLAPIEDGQTGALRAALTDERFFRHLAPPAAGAATPGSEEFPLAPGSARGVIVAGPAQPADPASYVAAVTRLARGLGWPVLADGLNPLRAHSAPSPGWIVNYNAVLRSAVLSERLRPEVILCLGEWPTSKQLRQWVEVADAEVWLLADDDRNHDSLHARTRQFRGTAEALAARLGDLAPPTSAYAGAWFAADAAARRAFDARLASLDFLFEGQAARLLSRHLPAGAPWMVASSMPIRDLEFFREANDRRHCVCFNRGANGIDGTLATALGLAHGSRPTVLLTGDLAFLHDTNGLLLRPKLRGSLTVVLINNRGGGIFEMLPAAKFDPPFEEYFATPQDVDIGRLCSAYGVEYVRVRDWEQFTGLISTLPASGLRVLELQTDRKRDTAFRRQLFAEAAQAAEAAGTERR